MELKYMVVFIIMILSCKTKNNNTDLKYGHLEFPVTGVGRTALIHLPPDSKVLVCGYKSNVFFWAVKYWAKAINREQSIKFEMQESCEKFAEFDAVVGGVNNISNCAKDQRGYADYGFKGKIGSTIVFCDEKKDFTTLKLFALHESGHAWGMCDQYVEKDGVFYNHGHHELCDEKFTNLEQKNQIMSGDLYNLPPKLSSQDILGIRILACRSDVTQIGTENQINDYWAQINFHDMQKWGGLFAEIEKLDAKIGGKNFIRRCYQKE